MSDFLDNSDFRKPIGRYANGDPLYQYTPLFGNSERTDRRSPSEFLSARRHLEDAVADARFDFNVIRSAAEALLRDLRLRPHEGFSSNQKRFESAPALWRSRTATTTSDEEMTLVAYYRIGGATYRGAATVTIVDVVLCRIPETVRFASL